MPGDKPWKWIDSGIFKRESNLHIPYIIQMQGLYKRSIVFKTLLKEYDSDEFITEKKSLIYSNKKKEILKHDHIYSIDIFDYKKHKMVIVDSTILSEYKDILYSDRRIVNIFK
jgi:hypothetical protein